MIEKFESYLPDRIEVLDYGSHIEITRRWLGWHVPILTVLTVLWFVALFGDKSWLTSSDAFIQFASAMVSLAFGAVGIAVSYFILASFFNRTIISVSRELVSVRHGPLPWIGRQGIKVSNIKRLGVQTGPDDAERHAHRYYTVNIMTSDNRNIRILSGLNSREQALYIEQQIEKYLRVKESCLNN